MKGKWEVEFSEY